MLSLVDLGVLNDRAGYETTEYETMVSLSCNRLDVFFFTSDALPHLQRVTHSINFSSFAANCMFFPVRTMFDVFFGGCKGLNSCLCLKRVTHSNVNPSLRFPRDNTICAIWRCITSKHIYSRRAHFISKTSKIPNNLQLIAVNKWSWGSFNTNYNILHPSSKKVKLTYEKEHEFFNNFH